MNTTQAWRINALLWCALACFGDFWYGNTPAAMLCIFGGTFIIFAIVTTWGTGK